MSFEWLNIPGISVSDSAGSSSSSVPQPPNVSFNFGGANVDQVWQPNATLHYQPQDSAVERRQNTEDLNGWDSNRRLVENGMGNGSQYHYGQHGSQQYPQQHQHQHSQNSVSQQSYFSRDTSKSPSGHNERNERHDSHGRVGQLTQDDYRESPEDLRVPLSLSHSQLTKEEIQTYLRWYTYITARKHVKLVRLGDVFEFLSNFKLSDPLKARITSIFRTCKNALNIGQFFAVLRLISRALLENIMPERKMILEKTPIPKPRPILCTNAKEETYEEVEEENAGNSDKVDFDSFASMLLTGNKPGKKRLRRKVINSMHRSKKVRFSEKITFQDPPSENDDMSSGAAPAEEDDDVIDFSLPMNQLLKRMARKKEKSSALVSQLPNEQHETEEEKEVLEDMKDSLSHFKQIQTPDMPGVSEQMASGAIPHAMSIGTANGSNGAQQSQQLLLQPLKPTSTGSANNLFKSALQPVPSLASSSGSNGQQAPMQPLKPTATGSANYLVRNQFDSQGPPQQNQQPQQEPQQNVTGTLQPLRPTATGSANYLMKSQFDQQPVGGSQARLSPNPIVSPAISPEGLSSPQNTNGYMNLNQLTSNQPALQYQQPVMQQNTSPPSTRYQQQPVLQSQTSPQSSNANSMVAPNPAQNYFQSLLSPSPSPAPAATPAPAPGHHNLNPPTGHSNLNISQSPSPYLSSSSLPQQGSTQQQPQQSMMYNNGYQYSSPLSSQQPQYYGVPQQQMQYPPYMNSFSPMQGQNYGNNNNILGDLHSLQQQVDVLQNVYGRR